MDPAARIVIVGAGMAGMATALSLKHHGQQISVIERDPAPPNHAPQDAFEAWKRPGVPQFRHSHMLLARLRTILHDEHPELLSELEAVGIHASTPDCILPPKHCDPYVPAPGDDDLIHLWGRRATFEAVLRRHVSRLDHVQLIQGVKVGGLVCSNSQGIRRVRGVRLETAGGPELLPADVVIDASGKRSPIFEFLRKQGLPLAEERHPARFLYFCRHYRLTDPHQGPRRGTGAILDYLWCGTFFAEDGHFSIALACPEEEHGLIRTLRRSGGFDWVCSQMPFLTPWIARAEPVSAVLGSGRLNNHWRTLPVRGSERILGLFAVGDALMQTNPIYGRGCSSAFVQAHALAETLAIYDDPQRRLAAYQRRVQSLLRPYFDLAVTSDRLFLVRARLARGQVVPLSDRLLCFLYDHVLAPAVLEDVATGREMVRTMEMSEISPLTRRLWLLVRILVLALSRPFRRVADPDPPLAPERQQLFRSLSLFEKDAGTRSDPGLSKTL